MDPKYSEKEKEKEKNPGKFQKKNLEFALCTGNYLKSIYIMLGIINNLDDLNYMRGQVYANTVPFSIRA